MVVPFVTDHLLSPAVRMRKQLGWEPFQVVQKPSFVSFQVPSAFEPPEPTGSRVILPSALNIILSRIPRMTHCIEQLSRRFRYRCQCLISSDRGNSWHTRRVKRNRMLFGSISTAA